MTRPIEIEVNGVTYYYERMDAFDALEAFGDLQRDILPAIKGLTPDTAIADGIATLSTALGGKQLRAWADRLLPKDRVSVEIDGEARKLGPVERKIVFDQVADILELMYRVIVIEFADPIFTLLRRFGLDQQVTGLASQLSGSSAN